ncbi:MAG TPA: Rieske 2Fe-2S domain-containing protein [Bacteroidota bacterium]|nr:Rieske 2Fe-2S domain-containing protein [Bacteroidota bacterium]
MANIHGGPPCVSRRAFIKTISFGAVTLGSLSALTTLESCTNQDAGVGIAPLTGQKVSIALANFSALQNVGGFVRSTFGTSNNAGNPVLIIRVAASGTNAFKTMSTVCTHAACLVNNPSGGQVACPCHGSVFSTSAGNFGGVAGGPAPSGLQTFATTFDGTNITITF